ncbi:MAG: Asp-tRNA(Asn)/Glu-tRNA(Gln) amidotransferase GatCAB subunit B [Opitutia bacterium]|nr:Asp-tRNA(Asn)/Glu-tRNA(Gln) amidotransferase subunit GatB [Opitutales bacterium]PHX79511.1 MAG: Asp-tRNA(Asn)/Glu-tRNA(Gln) amidotransferase GatCAB subunit B [Opitutae bacterium]
MSHAPSDWEVVIGLEVHVQLRTRAKVFASSSWGFGQEPNEQVDPVVLGLPGTLPVVNREAVEKAILFGLVVGAEIPERCAWDRKNYFYPDNPKNYQLTQKDFPVVLGGRLEIELPGASRNVMGEHKFIRIHHAHLEEDVGKLSHAGNGSLVDYNRAGVPLLEIVTEPDLRSSAEAEAFLRSLVAMLTQAGVADCDMEKGQLRCDCNVSVRRRGDAKLGTRTETKNLNSISSVRDTVLYETARQVRELEAGRTITQETRGWNAELARGYVLRDKEDAHDYRYFPDPDIPTLKISRETVARLARQVPENLYDRQRRYVEKLGLPFTAASVLVADRALSAWFEVAVAAHPANPQGIANLVANDLLRDLAASAGTAGASAPAPVSLASCRIKPAQLAGLVKLTDDGVISKQQAKEVFAEMFKSGQAAAAIVEAKGLRQNSDTRELEKIVQEVIADPAVAKSIAEYRAGNEKAINALKGPIMKRTQGKANPVLIDQLLRKFLG